MLFPPVWYKVNHPWFSADNAYRAVWYTLASESAWAYLTFVTETGHTFAVQVWRCTALRPSCEAYRAGDIWALYRPLTDTEREQPVAKKPATPNPDLALDIQ